MVSPSRAIATLLSRPPFCSRAKFVVLVLGATLLSSILGCNAPVSLYGTVMDPAQNAPDFVLHDHLNRPVSLKNYDAEVVVLTFLYTYCPELCPAVTSHLRDVQQMLGEDSQRINFIAISVDPERDTASRVLEYMDKWALADGWAYLIGEEKDLAPIWKNYHIDPSKIELPQNTTSNKPPLSNSAMGVKALEQDIATRYDIAHTAPVYLIDKEKQIRVVFTSPLDPTHIAHDIRQLLGS